MCFVGLLFWSLITHVGFSWSEESWCLESSYTDHFFTHVSDNFSWKYKYITDLHSKGKLYTYDYKSCSKPAKPFISLKQWRLLDKKESESAWKAHNMILTSVSIFKILYAMHVHHTYWPVLAWRTMKITELLRIHKRRNKMGIGLKGIKKVEYRIRIDKMENKNSGPFICCLWAISLTISLKLGANVWFAM